MPTPRVVALHLNVGRRAPLVPVASAVAPVGSGLEGDRRRSARRAVLFMEQEVLDRFGLPPGAVREQVTVRGLALGGLAPRARVRIGSALLEAAGPCDPCERMDEVQPGLRAALIGQRGRFFRVVEAGTLAVGDTITLLPAVQAPAG